jgi:hypothetical protein
MTIVRAFRLPVLLMLALCTLAGSPSPAAAQGQLTAERTVRYATSGTQPLDVAVGPVRVLNVQFADLGRPRPAPFGLGDRATDLYTVVRASFAAENPRAEDWVVKFTLEFLDRDGKIIDRAEKSSGLEGEAKTVGADHELLTYVVPLVDRVRVRFEAKLD